jgi:hypothetical protein
VPAMQRIEGAVDHGDGAAIVLELVERDDHDFVVCPSPITAAAPMSRPAHRARRLVRVGTASPSSDH